MAAQLAPEIIRAIECLATEGRTTVQIAGLLGLSERVVRRWRRIRGIASKRPPDPARVARAATEAARERCEQCGHPYATVVIDGRAVAVDLDIILATTFQPGASNERLVFVRRRHADVCIKYQIASGKIRVDEPARPPSSL